MTSNDAYKHAWQAAAEYHRREYDLHWDGATLTKAEGKTGNTLVVADTPSGFFSRISPCAALAPGDRLAPLNAALLAYLDREYDAGFGPVEAAPDLR